MSTSPPPNAGPATRLALVRPPRPTRRTWSGLVVLVVTAVAATTLWLRRTPAGASGGARALRRIIEGALQPELAPDYLALVAGDAILTTAYAVAAMSLATVAGLPAAVFASGVLVDGRWVRRGTRAALALLRAPHELVWGLVLVYAVGLSPIAGVLAIAIPYAGTIGRVLGDALEDVDPRPLAALGASGAGPASRLFYGIVPQVSADAVGYLAYRLECALRTATVLSFIGLGGLGQRIEHALLDLDYARAWTPLYATILLVMVIDRLGARYRRGFAR